MSLVRSRRRSARSFSSASAATTASFATSTSCAASSNAFRACSTACSACFTACRSAWISRFICSSSQKALERKKRQSVMIGYRRPKRSNSEKEIVPSRFVSALSKRSSTVAAEKSRLKVRNPCLRSSTSSIRLPLTSSSANRTRSFSSCDASTANLGTRAPDVFA
ncbi:hypothetical protein DQ04_11801000 [Trypanosoma grayi]|uniref:hypothetical protein n=1 Tax=Trypanosoma grayi TaxID=71804 RepID=UPI0004F40F0A|nr:hypothetical protein DQ04_11801000 [Trypanosoma grayi]KEG06880.1 hypothetical protein DQ04_11801000 [Trypanosoma grayi]